jgi:hypothetical protein
MAASQIIAVAATTITLLNKSPFLPQNPTHGNAVAGATVYGVNLPGKNARSGNYQKWRGDGVTVAFAPAAIVNLANAHVDGGSLGAADVLRVVVKVNGAVLQRVASGASPSAGQYKTSGSGTLTFGSTYTAADVIEVFLSAAADITTETLSANIPKEIVAKEVVYGSAAFQVVRLTQ